MSKCMIERLIICSKLSHFYVLRPKTVRFPSQKHTVSEPKPYVFGTETIKGLCVVILKSVKSDGAAFLME